MIRRRSVVAEQQTVSHFTANWGIFMVILENVTLSARIGMPDHVTTGSSVIFWVPLTALWAAASVATGTR